MLIHLTRYRCTVLCPDTKNASTDQKFRDASEIQMFGVRRGTRLVSCDFFTLNSFSKSNKLTLRCKISKTLVFQWNLLKQNQAWKFVHLKIAPSFICVVHFWSLKFYDTLSVRFTLFYFDNFPFLNCVNQTVSFISQETLWYNSRPNWAVNWIYTVANHKRGLVWNVNFHFHPTNIFLVLDLLKSPCIHGNINFVWNKKIT